jgi:Co/Zn/Cd efflux system component
LGYSCRTGSNNRSCGTIPRKKVSSAKRLRTTETALTAHLVRPEGGPADAFLRDAAHEFEEHFGIAHATLQLETDEEQACRLAPDEVV